MFRGNAGADLRGDAEGKAVVPVHHGQHLEVTGVDHYVTLARGLTGGLGGEVSKAQSGLHLSISQWLAVASITWPPRIW